MPDPARRGSRTAQARAAWFARGACGGGRDRPRTGAGPVAGAAPDHSEARGLAAQPRNREATLEVLTMGRIGVDLYPLQVGRSLADVETFGKYLGGSLTSVAVAAARYGRRAAVITRTGDDPFGTFI